jgi:hypothetical protein
MAKQNQREKYCDLCYACIHDCKEIEPITKCENFIKGYTRQQYSAMIREDNVDVKRLCDKKRLSYNYMMRMLNGKMHLKYKYRLALNSRLGEVEEYLPYVDKFEREVVNG